MKKDDLHVFSEVYTSQWSLIFGTPAHSIMLMMFCCGFVACISSGEILLTDILGHLSFLFVNCLICLSMTLKDTYDLWTLNQSSEIQVTDY